MVASAAARSAVAAVGRAANYALSFVVFAVLDIVDALLCVAYKLADYAAEAEWRPCYCSGEDMIAGGSAAGKIIVSEGGGAAPSTKVVCLSSGNKLHLEDVSATLYSRPAVLPHLAGELWRRRRRRRTSSRDAAAASSTATTFTVNSTVIEMLQGRNNGGPAAAARWSDCSCSTCSGGSKDTLFFRTQEPKEGAAAEDVLFIHGFISSSAFWTETVFPCFSPAARSRYRMFAVDLLGFGRSPKPGDSLYTLGEHVDAIERSVVKPYGLKSFHIVAHSLGSLIALAIAVKHPGAVKSLTLLSPPYFPPPEGEQGPPEYVLWRVAPRRIWPPIVFGASVACWYEHISRSVCLLICKNHRLWDSGFRFLTRNRVRTFLLEGFFCHTHHAAWHTLHNVICGSAGKLGGYLDAVRDRLSCDIVVLHGGDDELLPVECSVAVGARVPRASVRVVSSEDHISIIVGREREFAGELEEIWRGASEKKKRRPRGGGREEI